MAPKSSIGGSLTDYESDYEHESSSGIPSLLLIKPVDRVRSIVGTALQGAHKAKWISALFQCF